MAEASTPWSSGESQAGLDVLHHSKLWEWGMGLLSLSFLDHRFYIPVNDWGAKNKKSHPKGNFLKIP